MEFKIAHNYSKLSNSPENKDHHHQVNHENEENNRNGNNRSTHDEKSCQESKTDKEDVCCEGWKDKSLRSIPERASRRPLALARCPGEVLVGKPSDLEEEQSKKNDNEQQHQQQKGLVVRRREVEDAWKHLVVIVTIITTVTLEYTSNNVNHVCEAGLGL